MQLLVEAAQGISVVAFAWYGMSCFLSAKMVEEFERYRIGRLRSLTGILQVAGSVGLLLGHFFRPLLLLSAGGFTTMMLLAVITRVRIRDPWYDAIPAFSLFAINLFIFATAL